MGQGAPQARQRLDSPVNSRRSTPSASHPALLTFLRDYLAKRLRIRGSVRFSRFTPPRPGLGGAEMPGPQRFRAIEALGLRLRTDGPRAGRAPSGLAGNARAYARLTERA